MKKSAPKRAEFSAKIKRALADRNGQKCSFPGCPAVTVGPGHKDNLQRISSGQAAHIFSAADDGPRPNPAMSKEERSSIDNGIWMCNYHANLIDADECQYSADTLQEWKRLAVERAHHAQISLNGRSPALYTFIGIGQIVFSGAWVSAAEDNWIFEVKTFIQGSIEALIDYVSNFGGHDFSDKYVVVESQGDGRPLVSVSVSMDGDKYLVTCNTTTRIKRKSLKEIGSDLAFDDEFDIDFSDGDFKEITGIDLAIQELRSVLSTSYGDIAEFPAVGSVFSHIYHHYQSAPDLLDRLTKMEVIRLMTMPVNHFGKETSPPLLDFVDKIDQVNVRLLGVQRGIVPVFIRLSWADKNTWEGELKVFVREQTRRSRIG